MLEILILLTFAHAVADYPLQGAFLAKAKNRFNPVPETPWYQAMFGHCLIHAGAVWLITGSTWLMAAEFVIHWLTDDAKCAKKINYNTDQAIHIGCKVVWAAIAWNWMVN